ncbi:MAG: histidine--tRNA ligase [Patescibacteria group bacterium]
MSKKKTIKKKIFFQSPKGMHDILPGEQFWWEKMRKAANKVADSYNFLRIDTPIVETAEIFERSGKGTDIAEKQMYSLKMKGGDQLVLRPEGTAPIMRAYLQHGLSKFKDPLKLFYFGQMFRYEQPQQGRFRQHNQVGFEIIGSADEPIYDAQVILALFRLIEELKIKNLTIQINSIGCRVCRPAYVKKLQVYYGGQKDKLCRDCQRRLKTRPLRLLDCKQEKCVGMKDSAPIIVDRICNICKKHLKDVLEYLDEISLPYTLNPYLVRGLDYYNRTVFEIFSESSAIALGSGGRYDYLSEMLGGKKTFAVGGSVGVERLVETMKSQGILGGQRLGQKSDAKVFLVHIGEEAKKKNLVLLESLREAGIKTMEMFGRESLGSQMKAADKEKAALALIMGQKEVFEESVIIRDMGSGAQEIISLKKVAEEVKKRLK